MQIAKICDVQYIIDNTPLDKDIDPALITTMIMRTQNVELQGILGERLYRKLMFDIATNVIEQTYLELIVDYIQPVLAMYVHYKILPEINYRLTNKAISQKSSDNSTPADLDTVKYLRNEVKNDAEFMAQRLINHLKDNQDLYPDYAYDKGVTTKYFSGIYTDKNRRRK